MVMFLNRQLFPSLFFVLCLSLCLGVSNTCPEESLNITVVEDWGPEPNNFPSREDLVYNFNVPGDHLFETVGFETSILSQYFRLESISSNGLGILYKTSWIDREAIGRRLSDTYNPVLFKFNVFYINLDEGIADRCINVTVHIKDLDDQSPSFGSNETSANLEFPDNNNEVDNEKLIPAIGDHDEGVNGTSVFELTDPSGKFRLEFKNYSNTPRVNHLFLANRLPLDYEEQQSYQLSLTIREGNDNPEEATLIINVEIDNSCDENPEFVSSRYTPSVSEDLMHNSQIVTVNATDRDDPNDCPLIYSITEVCRRAVMFESACQTITNENDYPFTLDSESGVLTLTGDLDREMFEEYEVKVQAADMQMSASAVIAVTVEDVNDNDPMVRHPNIVTELSEEHEVDRSIGRFRVEDSDAGPNGNISVTLYVNSSGMETLSQLFQVRKIPMTNTYEMFHNDVLDYERQQVYHLVIHLRDHGNPVRYNTESITITIRDENDHPPVFGTPTIYLIEENSIGGTIVATVNATDADSGSNGEVHFTLPENISDFPHQDLFNVTELSGNILVRQGSVLDYEERSNYTIRVRAHNPVVNSQEAYQEIVIFLTNLNDNRPSILPLFQIWLRETETSGHPIVSIPATDADNLGPLVYSLLPGSGSSLFSIDSSGGLVLQGQLDYETEQSYNLMVQVSDGDLTNMTSVMIIVVGENDERPEFDAGTVYSGTVIEEMNNAAILTVSATDRDIPAQNTTLTYYIKTGAHTDRFRINPTNGTIYTAQPLDREEISSYVFHVVAGDGRQNSTEKSVTVQVLDINDHTPEFLATPYNFELPERAARNTTVGTVSVLSLDDGLNGEVVFEIIDGNTNGWFSIHPDSGEIKSNIVFDREVNDTLIIMTVKAMDKGEVPLFNLTQVTVTITDVNDNEPEFPLPYYNFTVREDFPVGQVFGKVVAIDLDGAGNNVTRYSFSEDSFSNGMDASSFRIEQFTGELSLVNSLDFETVNMTRFTVIATDNERGDFQTSVLVLIDITNARDLNLTFGSGYSPYYTVVENTPINHEIARIRVTDSMNMSITRPLMYELYTLDYELSPYFRVYREESLGESVGVIHTDSNSIDREAADLGEDRRYELILNVSDPVTGTDSYGYIVGFITIEILDENDNSPKFSATETHFEIEENGAADEVVATFEVMDPDAGDNGTLSVSISESAPFRVESAGGQQYRLLVASPLDRENQAVHELNLQAVDRGTPPKTETLLVIVNVRDVNDNAPVFCEPPPESGNCVIDVKVKENLELQSVVATVMARDADYGTNAEIRYSFLPGNHGNLFSIQALSGNVILGERLNIEDGNCNSEYVVEVEVRATDRGGRSSIATLKIKVEDVNEFAPEFTNVSYTTNIPENYPPNVPFSALVATDGDVCPNNEVKYVLADNTLSKIFKVDKDTGAISVQELSAAESLNCPPIDYEREREYKVDIIAYDAGSPRMYTTQTLTVQIDDVNEHDPMFDDTEIDIVVSENTPIGTVVMEIKAYDDDFGDNLVHTLSPNSFFLWDNSELRLKKEVNFDALTFIMLTLNVSDGEKSDGIAINVHIRNENDHVPIFSTQDDQTITIYECTEPGTRIFTVHATDADNSTSDAVRYNISSGNVGEKFYINPRSGVLYVAKGLDYENVTRYDLTIKATDTGSPTRTSSPLIIRVEIKNENDEVPEFTESAYTFTLVENNLVRTSVGCVRANDRDVGDFGITVYSIVGDGGKPDFFAIEDGCIFALRMIDREKDSEFQLIVEARDQANPSVTARVGVTVTIGDLNDNGPQFSKPIYISYIWDDHDASVALVPNVIATDPDSTVNATFEYEIVSQSPSLINLAQDGQITLASGIPTQYDSNYTITIRARSTVTGDSRSSDATVIVIIESNTEHHPRFISQTYTRNVSENSNTGTVIFDVSSEVRDQDGTSDLEYFLVEGNTKFALDSETGVLRLDSNLNFEEERRYELKIRVNDPTSRSATASLIVNVEDGNDHAPIITSHSSHSIIHLSPVPHTNIHLFTVKANDSDVGPQGTVGFSVIDHESASARFEIDPRTGVVRNKINLVRNENYSFVVRAYDHGSPLKSSNVTVNIQVHDTTATTPQFDDGTNSIDIELAEDKDSNTDPLIREFSTTPTAESYHLVYSNATSGAFSIDTQNRLVLNTQLDYEKTPQYLLIIEARSISDGLRLSSFLLVNIIVTDVNDNRPYFPEIPTQTISELSSRDTLVFTAVAMDDDSGTNAQLTYAITDGSVGETFVIDPPTGEVRVGRLLDREERSNYTLTIRATDRGADPLQTETTVTIEVEDVNDNEPKFSQAGGYTVSVYEFPHSQIGDYIIQLIATDADLDSLNYRILDLEAWYEGMRRTVPSDIFDIDFDTGNITLQRNLNREEVDRYFARIEVRDSINNVDQTNLTVHVLDVNDNTPVFGSNPGTVNVWELSPVNTIVIHHNKLSVTDRDAGQNGIVKYSLGSGWSEDYLKIDPWTGTVRVKSIFEFDSRGTNEYNVIIKAQDQGIPSRSAEITVRISINDVNNHPPNITNTNFNFEISVDHPLDKKIQTFNYSDDQDVIFNSLAFFRIPPYYDEARALFSIVDDGRNNPDTLKLRRRPNSNEITEHTFRIEAIQQGSNPYCPQYIQAAYASVTVVIHRQNNYSPHFANNSISYEISESTEPGETVEIKGLIATDKDNNSISYKILTPDVPFALIDPSSPIITITAELDADHPSTAQYTLTIQASDDGFPVRSSSAILSITIGNTNDIPPRFELDSYTTSVEENSEPGFYVTTISANDTDSIDLTYTIVYPDDCSGTCFPFEIDNSGKVKTTSEIDFEKRTTYSFRMTVSDGDYTTSVPVTINVNGVNEYPPQFRFRVFNFTAKADEAHIGRIEATDLDDGNDGRLRYSFGHSDYDILELNEITGEISIKDAQEMVFRRKREIIRGGDKNMVTLQRGVTVHDSSMNDTALLQVFFDETLFNTLVGETSPAVPTATSLPYEIIIIVVVAVIAAILLFLTIIIIACLCRRQTKKNQKFKVENAHMGEGGSEMTERYCRNGTVASLDTKNTETKIRTGNSASGSERSYSGMADDEMESGNERYTGTSPHLPNKPLHSGSSRVRSTSDLASSVGTEALHSQTNEHPYTKAQLMRIYAHNEGLLDDTVSHDSVHMFGSEGGGEVDGELDINNLIYQKINDLEDDEESTTIMDDDASTTYSKGRGNVLTGSVSNMEPDDPLPFTGSTKPWIPPNGRTIADAIDEITGTNFASQEEPPRRHGYDLGPYSHSQGASLYNPSATQESYIGIQHLPKVYKDHKPQDYSRRYYPEDHHDRISRERDSDHHRTRYQMSQRYGSASVLPDYHHQHHHHQPHHSSHSHSHNSHHHRVPGSRSQQHYRSQDLAPPYTKYSPYTAGPRRPHPNTYMTPTEGTDGTVTPQTALTGDYHYLSSSSTSLTSTNVSGNLSQPSRPSQMYH